MVFADWDRDGDLDLFLEAGGAVPGDQAHNVLFENPGHGHHWLTLQLGRHPDQSRRDRRPGPRRPVRARRPALGPPRDRRRVELRRQPPAPTIGLGRARAIDAVEISWPDGGTRQIVRDVPLDRAVEITEGREGFRLLERARPRGPGLPPTRFGRDPPASPAPPNRRPTQ